MMWVWLAGCIGLVGCAAYLWHVRRTRNKESNKVLTRRDAPMSGNLFTLPKQTPINNGVTVPGAKLTFSQTGTSTPQNTYTDIDLTTPHDNPVIADSEGVFAPIYLDPALPDYRVTLSDTDDTQLYQVDDVPAGSAGKTITLSDDAPYIDFVESDASANNSVWRVQVNSEQLLVRLGNDDKDSFSTIVAIDRTANTGDSIAITAPVSITGGVTSSGAYDNVGRGWDVCKYKSDDQSRDGALADVMANDEDLVYAVPAAGTYAFELFATVWGSTSGTQGGVFNMNYSGTRDTASRYIIHGSINGSSIGHVISAVANTTTVETLTAGDVSTTAYTDGIYFRGVLIASTTGNLGFAWAQDALDASNALNVGKGSYLAVKRLS